MRTFLAIYPAPQVVERLREFQSKLGEGLSPSWVRWTNPQQIHLTLVFIADIDPVPLDTLRQEGRVICRAIPPFSLRVERVGCFPDSGRPSVGWAGLDGDLSWLTRLKSEFDALLRRQGIVVEQRSFQPHLTLARVKPISGRDRRAVGERCAAFAHEAFGEWKVEEVCLMRSEPGRQCAEHTLLESFPLGTTSGQWGREQ